MSLAPRVVIVHRCSEYDELLAHYGTAQHAEFLLRQSGRDLEDLRSRHDRLNGGLREARQAIPEEWRSTDVERADLCRFAFAPEDVIVVVGQDGLVANVAKYLDGQPMVGIDPDPDRNPGVLVSHTPDALPDILADLSGGADLPKIERTMVRAVTDDGRALQALNEVYVGHISHQSARYMIGSSSAVGEPERQSSSGVLIGTGTGATGWLRSAWLERQSNLILPAADESKLCWFVREAWPSPATGTSHTEGVLEADETLTLQAESDLVCFGDGIESDRIPISWGQTITVSRATQTVQMIK